MPPEASSAPLKATYTVVELARLAGHDDARRMTRLLRASGVRIRSQARGRSGEVTLSDLRRADAALWDSILEKAAMTGG